MTCLEASRAPAQHRQPEAADLPGLERRDQPRVGHRLALRRCSSARGSPRSSRRSCGRRARCTSRLKRPLASCIGSTRPSLLGQPPRRRRTGRRAGRRRRARHRRRPAAAAAASRVARGARRAPLRACSSATRALERGDPRRLAVGLAARAARAPPRSRCRRRRAAPRRPARRRSPRGRGSRRSPPPPMTPVALHRAAPPIAHHHRRDVVGRPRRERRLDERAAGARPGRPPPASSAAISASGTQRVSPSEQSSSTSPAASVELGEGRARPARRRRPRG